MTEKEILFKERAKLVFAWLEEMTQVSVPLHFIKRKYIVEEGEIFYPDSGKSEPLTFEALFKNDEIVRRPYALIPADYVTPEVLSKVKKYLVAKVDIGIIIAPFPPVIEEVELSKLDTKWLEVVDAITDFSVEGSMLFFMESSLIPVEKGFDYPDVFDRVIYRRNFKGLKEVWYKSRKRVNLGFIIKNLIRFRNRIKIETDWTPNGTVLHVVNHQLIDAEEDSEQVKFPEIIDLEVK